MKSGIFLIALSLVAQIDGHGRLIVPAGRSTLWRYPDIPGVEAYVKDGNTLEKNYNDNQLFCGGFEHQQSQDGKCGVCGDPYDGARENEANGKYAKGIITGTYQTGDRMVASVQITAHHKGYFEFRLCPVKDMHTPATEDCLNQNLLVNIHNMTTKWFLPPPDGTPVTYDVTLILPDGLSCEQCVFQWRYHTGNSYGCDYDPTNCCVGCGPQEEFYGCADIKIVDYGIPQLSSTTTKSTNPPKSTSTEPPATQFSSTTTTDGSQNNKCQGKEYGEYAKNDCSSYYWCLNDPILYPCAPDTVVNERPNGSIGCDWPANVPEPCGTLK